MKINKLLAALLAATTLFASCSKEDGKNTTNGDDRTVQIRIDRASSANTRGVGGQVEDESDVTFTSGYLVFTNQGDIITWAVAVSTGSTAYDEAAKTVGIGALETGSLITAVPGNSTEVHFIGNAPSGVTPVVGGTLSSYSATVLSQYSQGGTGRIPVGGVANVTLYGGADLTPSSAEGATDDQYEAEFNVAPIAARFEIKAITGAHSDGVTDFEYTVAGIFIDNYYDAMTIVGTGSGLKYNGSNAALYTPDAVGSSYTAAMGGSVYDYNTGADEDTFAPASGVWTYNMLAPTLGSPVMPAIIIKLTDVKVGTFDYGTQFLTIQKFYNLVEDEENEGEFINGSAITQLAQGKIYVLDNVVFDENDFTINPYIKTLKVAVTVNMLKWESNSIGWEF